MQIHKWEIFCSKRLDHIKDIGYYDCKIIQWPKGCSYYRPPVSKLDIVINPHFCLLERLYNQPLHYSKENNAMGQLE